MLPPVFRLTLALLLMPLLSLSPAAAEERPAETEPLLQVEGVLEDSDPVWPEGNTRYDEYPFEGQAGQTITIVLESLEFDTYVLLKNPAGQTVGQNDDYDDGSAITFTLPESGTYTIVTNAYGETSRGDYRLTVLAGSEPVFLTVEEQIRALEQQLAEYQAAGDRENEAQILDRIGGLYYKQGQYSQALDVYQEALEKYQSLNDFESIGFTLFWIGKIFDTGQCDQALVVYQQGLEAWQKAENEVDRLQGEALVQFLQVLRMDLLIP